jgi:membrane protease YdiL (CAAX protease family)
LTATDVFLTLVAIVIFAVIIVAANYADRDRNARTRRSVVTALLLINALIVVVYGVMQVVAAYTPATSSYTPPAKPDAWGGLLASVIVSGLATLMLYRPLRVKLAVLFPRFRGKIKVQADAESAESAESDSDLPPELQPKLGGTPLFPQALNYYTTDSIMVPRSTLAASSRPVDQPEAESTGRLHQVRGFNPDSTVHMVALVMCVYLVGVQMINFILGGGLGGVAKTYEGGLTVWDLLVNSAPFVILAPLGAGLGLRRNWSQLFRRLGLVRPTAQGVMAAVGVTIALFIFVSIVGVVWMGLVSKATYEEQTKASNALSQSVTSLGLAFMVAATAAVGEEIAFRGALQPVLGLWPTAIIFALTHIQYTLTPAWLIILGVAVAFGWIRDRYSTTASMMTHFMYDFIPLAAGVSVSGQGLVWILHLL